MTIIVFLWPDLNPIHVHIFLEHFPLIAKWFQHDTNFLLCISIQFTTQQTCSDTNSEVIDLLVLKTILYPNSAVMNMIFDHTTVNALNISIHTSMLFSLYAWRKKGQTVCCVILLYPSYLLVQTCMCSYYISLSVFVTYKYLKDMPVDSCCFLLINKVSSFSSTHGISHMCKFKMYMHGLYFIFCLLSHIYIYIFKDLPIHLYIFDSWFFFSLWKLSKFILECS